MATPRRTPSGRWTVQIEVAGQRCSETFDTKAEASAWGARRATELRAARKAGVNQSATLRDALRRYAREVSPTKRGERLEIVRLAAFEKPEHVLLGADKRLMDITPASIGRWRDARLKMVKPGSVLRDLTLLSSVLEHARREWQWVQVNAVRDVRKPSAPAHRDRIITGPEVRAMLRQLGWPRRQVGGVRAVRSVSEAVAVTFMLALSTGARAGELCSARWCDVRADHVRVNGKTGVRDVPLSSVALRLLDMLRGFDDELVCGLKPQTLDALFRRARVRAGLDGFTFHDARHTAATRLAQRLSVLDLCKVFGWSNTSQALTYYNPTAGELAKLLEGRSV